MLKARADGDARVCTNAESPCGPRGQSRSIPSRLLAEPREHEVMRDYDYGHHHYHRRAAATTITAVIIIGDGRRTAAFWGSPSSVHAVTTGTSLRKGVCEGGNPGYHTFLIAISNTFAPEVNAERREVRASRGCAARRDSAATGT